MIYERKRIIYEVVEVDANDLLALTEVAQELGLGLSGVISAINRGQLTEYRDPGAVARGRAWRTRFVLRSQVEAMKSARLPGPGAET
jgi:hypothetical protein